MYGKGRGGKGGCTSEQTQRIPEKDCSGALTVTVKKGTFQERKRKSHILMVGTRLSIRHDPSLPELEMLQETQLLAPYLKTVWGIHSLFPWDPPQRASLSSETCLGRDPEKRVLFSPPADSLQKLGAVRRGDTVSPAMGAPAPDPQAPDPQARQRERTGLHPGREAGLRVRRQIPCASLDCSHTFTRPGV